jgi:hypothetical protein
LTTRTRKTGTARFACKLVQTEINTHSG